MKNLLISTAAAAALSLGIGNAAVQTGTVFTGSSLGFAQILNSTDDFEFEIDVIATEPLDILVEVSATGFLADLDNITTGIGDVFETVDSVDGSDFEGLNIVPRGTNSARGAAFYLFENFTSSEAFSIFVLGDGTFSADTPFTVSIFATASDDIVGEVPVPAAGLLLATAMGGFAVARRKKKA